MDTPETARLCKDVNYASTQIRTLLGDRAGISETLDRFWLLQDLLNRLIDVVGQERGEVSQCHSVIRNVVSALESPQAKRQANTFGVQAARDKINGLLLRLEQANAPAAS